MANKRIFSNMVIDSDSFLDLSPMAQLLYFHCGMKTDDDGFVSGARRIARIIGATDNDFQLLIENGFLIEFPDSKVFVIVHHRQNNDLKNDRYHPTNYQQEISNLELTENKEWRLKQVAVSTLETECIQDVSNMSTEQNVTHPNVTHSNVTNISIGKGSDEGETTDSVNLLRCMAQQAGITTDVEKALAKHGFSVAYSAFVAWKNDGAVIGRYNDFLKQKAS